MKDGTDLTFKAPDLVPARVRFRMACTFASEESLWAIGLLTEIAGAISIFRTCPWNATNAMPARRPSTSR